jgi:glycosyltransferase involved in cell wall biosynthesis
MEYGTSILFATHNGERTLPVMLEALSRLHTPMLPWEVIAVDNASTDATPQILERASKKLPMKVLFSGQPGKNPSLQLGAKHVQGQFVLFTDDDVKPTPDWLTSYEAAVQANPNASLFGGPIFPVPLEPLSPWFEASRNHHAVLFARSEPREGSFDAVRSIYGPNLLIRREYLGVLSDVPDNLGPTFRHERSYAMGEDTAMVECVIKSGAVPCFVPHASVEHLVRAYQTELNFMLERAQRHGKGVSLRRISASRRPSLTRLRVLVESMGAYVRARLAAPRTRIPREDIFDRLWNVHWPVGAIKGVFL